MKKVLTVFGTRPEALKMALLVKALDKCPTIESRLCVTSQHKELLDQVINLFELKPDYNLNIMKANQDLFDITSGVLLGMREVLREYQPDVVLVHGDTTTTFAVSLAAFYEQIQIGHIEAGLRTYNLTFPWPEEMNRQLTDRITDYHFTPTALSRQNLLNEGIEPEKILITGNTAIDTLLFELEKIDSNEQIEKSISLSIEELGYKISSDRKFIVVTVHRRENIGEKLGNIFTALKTLASQNQDVDIVFMVHLNPKVRKRIKDLSNGPSNIKLIEPLDYDLFIYLISKSHLILTDSGGIQEEAPCLGKPVLLLRDNTERPEAIESGTVKLVGTETTVIVNETEKLLTDVELYRKMSQKSHLYGAGNACNKIVDFLRRI